MPSYHSVAARLAPALFALSVVTQPAAAESGKAALVIGNSAYQHGRPLGACDQSAREVSLYLQHEGFAVDVVLNASSIALRSAIGSFVTRLSGAPQKAAIVYVCTYAAVANQRLFMLPIDWDPDQVGRLETQGVIVKALLNTLVGTQGVLFADLGLPPDKAAGDALDLLQSELPSGVHFAMVARQDDGIGTLGHGLSKLLGSSGEDWGKLAAAFQAQQGAADGSALAIFAPLTGPMPPASANPAPPPAPAVATAVAAAEPAPQTPVVLTPVKRSTPDPAPPPPAAAPDAHPPTPVEVAAAVPPPPPPSNSNKMTRIQAALMRRGFLKGPLDGHSGRRTEAAVLAFQASLGDPASGVLTPIEIVRLLNER